MVTRVECEYVKGQRTTRELVQTPCAAVTACAVSYGHFVDEVCECWRFVYSSLASAGNSLLPPCRRPRRRARWLRMTSTTSEREYSAQRRSPCSLETQASIPAALSANLMGSMLGGFLEYNSMVYGFDSLWMLALAMYAAAFLGRFVRR